MEKKKETIFDHGVTEMEIIKLFGIKGAFTESFFQELPQERNDIHIFRLYEYRKNKQMAKIYLDKIPNSDYKLFTLLNHCYRH